MDVTIAEALRERTDGLPVNLFEIDLTIHWSKDGREKLLTLRTLKLVDNNTVTHEGCPAMTIEGYARRCFPGEQEVLFRVHLLELTITILLLSVIVLVATGAMRIVTLRFSGRRKNRVPREGAYLSVDHQGPN